MDVNGLTMFFFMVALAFAAFGLADRRWYKEPDAEWNGYLGREAPEPSPTALVVERGLFLACAAGMVFAGVSLRLTDTGARHADLWTDAELHRAVTRAAPHLGTDTVVYGEDIFPDHSADIENAVDNVVSDDAPLYGVQVEPTGGSRTRYEVTADGADAVFCVRVRRTDPPRGPDYAGGSASHVRHYTLKGRVRSGHC